MSPEQVLRTYFHAKDENRPHLLASVFCADAQLEIRNRSAQISFPAVTVGLDPIADVLVRRFNQNYENIYSFYLARPRRDDETFACYWLVGMTDKETRSVRVGFGSYDWTFERTPSVRARRLVITIEAMLVLEPACATSVMNWLQRLDYPWTSAANAIRARPPGELAGLTEFLTRASETAPVPITH